MTNKELIVALLELPMDMEIKFCTIAGRYMRNELIEVSSVMIEEDAHGDNYIELT